MTTITIVNETADEAEPRYRASSGGRQSVGATAGAALDALTKQLDPEEAGTVVVLQNLRPDEFFTAAQQRVLRERMDRQQAAVEAGVPLPPAERAQLESLIDAELDATMRRAEKLLNRGQPT